MRGSRRRGPRRSFSLHRVSEHDRLVGGGGTCGYCTSCGTQGTHNVDQKYRDPRNHDARLTGFGAAVRGPVANARRDRGAAIGVARGHLPAHALRPDRPAVVPGHRTKGGGALRRSRVHSRDCKFRLRRSKAPVGDRGGLPAGGTSPPTTTSGTRTSCGRGTRTCAGPRARTTVPGRAATCPRWRTAAERSSRGCDRGPNGRRSSAAQRVPPVRVQLGPGRRGAGGARSGARESVWGNSPT